MAILSHAHVLLGNIKILILVIVIFVLKTAHLARMEVAYAKCVKMDLH